MKAETNEVTTEIDIKLFTPHANFDDAINRAICQSDIEGGVALDALPLGTVLHVQTMNHLYRLENRGEGEVIISGHPQFCPEPVLVHLHGSTWGTPMIRTRFIGRGLKMEFNHPDCGIVLTSWVREIQEIDATERTESRGAGASGKRRSNSLPAPCR